MKEKAGFCAFEEHKHLGCIVVSYSLYTTQDLIKNNCMNIITTSLCAFLHVSYVIHLLYLVLMSSCGNYQPKGM